MNKFRTPVSAIPCQVQDKDIDRVRPNQLTSDLLRPPKAPQCYQQAEMVSMAVMTAPSMTAAGQGVRANRLSFRSGLGGARLVPTVPRARRTAASVQVRAAADGYQWLRKDPLVFVLGFLGWTVPANIPVAAFGGKSLFGLLLESIGQELAKFPTGPALTDPFWLYLVLYHVGLFLALTLAQIGVQARKSGYFG
eukprot:jgi/Botrbrau1/420/Bobra.110_2s0070.1